jgi:hypothetical protein
MASSLGKMPTTSVRRLISPLTCSIGLVELQLGAMCDRKGHVGEHVDLGLVHERGELRQFGAQLVGDPAPLCASRFGIVLGEGSGDEGGDTIAVWQRHYGRFYRFIESGSALLLSR